MHVVILSWNCSTNCRIAFQFLLIAGVSICNLPIISLLERSIWSVCSISLKNRTASARLFIFLLTLCRKRMGLLLRTSRWKSGLEQIPDLRLTRMAHLKSEFWSKSR